MTRYLTFKTPAEADAQWQKEKVAQALAVTDDVIVDGLAIETYHRWPKTVSKSGLDTIHESPRHYFGRYMDPRMPASVAKGGQVAGSMLHCAVLEPDQFKHRYVVGPDVNRNTKEWKAFAESLLPGQEGIKSGEAWAVQRQAESVRRVPDVARLLGRGRPELSAFWRDEKTGVLCRCRPDWTHVLDDDAGVILLDLKTFAKASSGPFMRQAAQKRYHVQDGWYSDGYAQSSGMEVRAFLFCVVETEWPFVAHVMCLDDASRELGRTEYRADLDTYAECVKSGDWPGPGPGGVEMVGLPNWAFYAE